MALQPSRYLNLSSLREGVSSGPLSPSVPSTPGLAGKGSSLLSSKVTSILSTSYADTEFRDALNLLDERGLINSAETRRQLRLDVQKEVIDANGKVIAEFGKVSEQLRRIGATIDKLNKSHGAIVAHVTQAHRDTSGILNEATTLMLEKQQVETKQKLLDSFRSHFVLTGDEVAVLTLTAEPVDDRFFGILAKAKRINKDCEILLGFENQTLGSEIMEQTSKNLNLAFQKLYRWIQREFKTLNLENPQISASVRRALRVLSERPSLFQSCLDFFSEAREQILSSAFYTALTGTTSSGTQDHSTKPIELAAHDSLRYVGDMLAWTHSATVSEREALETLFISDGNELAKGIQQGRENELWRLMADETDGGPDFDAVQALNDLVDRDVSGVARILRQRVEQVIQANEDTILAYKQANLLGFYRVTFSKLLGDQAVLLDAMRNLEMEALRQFRSLMRDHIATLQGDFQHTPSDLGPPDFLQDSLKKLEAIMKSYETSLATSGDREADFRPILAESFDPFLAGCENMTKNVEPPSDSIFYANCLMASKAALMPFAFANKRAQQLQSTLDEHKERLVQFQYRFFREECGLAPIFDCLKPLEANRIGVDIMRGLKPLSKGALIQASQTLDDFLPSALMDAIENVKHLQDAKMAQELTEEAANRFCLDFEHAESLLIHADEIAEEEEGDRGEVREDNAGSRYKTWFPRTTGEIRVLLS